MKKSELMKKQMGRADAGFTLIELMIVIAIIGILVAVAIPNFLRAMDKARYNRCVQVLSALKVAEEMFISDNNIYTDDAEQLGMYMIPGCTDPAGCPSPNDVQTRLDANCQPGTAQITLVTDYEYQITGTSQDRTECLICVSAKGFKPENYSLCPSDGSCP